MNVVKTATSLAVGIGICVLVTAWCFSRLYIIPSESMRPGLVVGDIVWCVPHLGINRGDIIVFRHSDSTVGIKRVAGLPGDTVRYFAKELEVNGTTANKVTKAKLSASDPADLLLEQVLFDKSFDVLELYGASLGDISSEGPGYFVIGDNRDYSTDSRQLGRLSDSQVLCKAVAVLATEVAGKLTLSRFRWL